MAGDAPDPGHIASLLERLRGRLSGDAAEIAARLEGELATLSAASERERSDLHRAAVEYRAERDILRLVAGLAEDGFDGQGRPAALVEAARRAVGRMPRVEHGCLFVFDPDGTPEVISPIRIEEGDLPLLMEQISHGIVGQVWRTGKPVYCEEAAADRSFQGLESVRSLGMKTVLCEPIPGDEGQPPRGALYVENRTRADAFPHAWREAVRLLALQLAQQLALLEQGQRRQVDPTHRLRQGGRFTEFVGRSAALAGVMARIDQIATQATPRTVLIVGETGVGKELVARALHHHGPRRDAPFVPVNTAALQPSLAEAELFGATRGAYTGAATAREGLFSAADGGVLFLDEIGEIPQEIQVKLLRVLDEPRIRPVGATDEVEVDVWIVAATNRNLESAVADGTFRRDLYFRLAESVIQVPPLRVRPEDIDALAVHFATEAAARLGRARPFLEPDLLAVLRELPLEGNARELRGLMEWLVERHDQPILTAEHLRTAGSGGDVTPPAAPHLPDWKAATHRFQASYLRWAMARWPSPAELARQLGIHRSYLYRLAAKLGVELPRGDSETRD
jgi:transcriptional regulator with GAF, ATPase, and Fis domain